MDEVLERWIPRPASRTELVLLTVLALAVVAIYVLLATLEPAVRGFGTHEQLGMAPCSWILKHGEPCPTCGVTTAAVLLLHGRPIDSFSTQPFGMLLTVAGAVFAVAGLVCVFRGHSLIVRLARWPWGWIFLGGAATLIASWRFVASGFGGG